MQKVEIGKGTFYHYFTSKEEVMDYVIDRMVESIRLKAQMIADDSTKTALQKLPEILFSINISESSDGQIIDQLHEPNNALMHQKSIVKTILSISPILANVICQGEKEGVFNTLYPKETIEFLLAANQFIFDTGIFKWTSEETMVKAQAFVLMVELTLGAKEGCFSFILEMLSKQQNAGE